MNVVQKIEIETKPQADTRIARAFLQGHRPGGPWVLVAIIPIPAPKVPNTITETVTDEDGIQDFIDKHNGTRNIYFTVNECCGPMFSKPKKTDIAVLTHLWSDNDPQPDEPSDDAKVRIQKAVAKYPKRGVTIDSGNGLQTLFRLGKDIPLGEPLPDGVDENGKPKYKFTPEGQATVDDVEARNLELTLTLGSEKDKGTQNIDRIMRVPGTWNHPNKKKLREGRKKCWAKLLTEPTAPKYPLSAFPKAEAEPESEPLDFDSADDGEDFASGYDDDDKDQGDTGQGGGDDELARTIKDGGGNRHGKSRSENVFYVACELVWRRKTDDEIADVLCDPKNGISESIRETKHPRQTALRQAARARKKVGTSKPRNDYFWKNGCTYWKSDKGLVLLANFVASITEDTKFDDGSGKPKVIFTIESNLGTASVPSEQFDSLSWVTPAFRSRARISEGSHIRGRLANAIKTKDADICKFRDVYAHTGWRKINDAWLYLHTAGAIGVGGHVPGVDVEIDGELAHYQLPTVVGDPCAAMKASLRLLDMAPRSITWPLQAAVYLAPLAEFLAVTLSVFFSGGSGVRKTAMQTVALAHWYYRSGKAPANWSSTANSLEAMAFRAKDALLVVDDFCPRGTQNDIHKMHSTAERLLRAQANRAGRQRMNADSSTRAELYPRGVVVASGEDIPSGHSLQARMVVRKVTDKDVNLAVLTELQVAAGKGTLKQAMAGYVSFVARQDKSGLTRRMENLRAEAGKRTKGHNRTPENIAQLMLGIENMLDYAVEVGALSAADRDRERDDAWNCLLAVADEQATQLKAEQPAERFCALLSGVLSSGRAHILDMSAPEPTNAEALGWRHESYHDRNGELRDVYKPLGNAVGWIDGDDVYLSPDATYAAVKTFAQAQGTPFNLTMHTLWERLHEAGLIKQREKEHYTAKKTINGQRPRVLYVSAAQVLGFTEPVQPAQGELRVDD